MAHEKLRPHYFFDEEKVAKLKQLAPECFKDGKIDFETLRENLGDWTQNEEDPELEHFGLFWPGKRDARKAAAIAPEGTLEPVWGSGMKADGTPDTDGKNDSKNVFIEGENLEVLKLLQKSYAGRVKMIYIDPPYNTGNDFVYDDDFTEPLQEYLRRTGQVDEEGKAMTSNKKSDGRFHSKWLSMMYPRLRLGRNLLREDGIMFVSIDDNEIHNLRAIMNEIFGEENFIEQLIWKKRYGAGGGTGGFARLHEYILIYGKGQIENIEAPLSQEQIETYKTKDENFSKRGGYVTQPLATSSKGERGNLMYSFNHLGKLVSPKEGSRWLWSKDKFEKAYSNNQIIVNESDDGFSVRFKQYLYDEDGKIRNGKPISIKQDVFNQEGTKEVAELLGKRDIFDFPKPVQLLKYLFSFIINDKKENEGIFMDFFAGSGSTAHAILELNSADDGKRKSLSVQIPAELSKEKKEEKNGYDFCFQNKLPAKITSISRERIMRAAKKLKSESLHSESDWGFRTLSLNRSNFASWKNYMGTSTFELENQLDLFNQNPLRDGYTKDSLLSEVMLLEGFTLCSEISSVLEIDTNSIKKITSEYCEHALLVCLDDTIQNVTISRLHLGNDDIFICLDSAVSTEDKLRLSDKGLIKTI